MILSGTVTLDPAAHAASTDSMRTRLAELEERRLSAGRSIELVLASWRGEAAETLRDRWEEWDRGAQAVIDQLGHSLAALDRFRTAMTGADDASAASTTRLGGRLA